MPWSNYLRNAINDHVVGGGDYTRPGTLYFARYTVPPTAAGGGTEVGGRVGVTNDATNFPASSGGGSKKNAVDIDWGTAGSDLGMIVAIGVFDASSGGNFLGWGLLTTPREVLDGDPFKIVANGLEFTYLE